MLLAVARTLVARRTELSGEIRFLFQHAEELPPSGARELVAAGAVEGVDAVLGAHLISTLEVGEVGVLDGPAPPQRTRSRSRSGDEVATLASLKGQSTRSQSLPRRSPTCNTWSRGTRHRSTGWFFRQLASPGERGQRDSGDDRVRRHGADVPARGA
jgi:hypothetical protein